MCVWRLYKRSNFKLFQQHWGEMCNIKATNDYVLNFTTAENKINVIKEVEIGSLYRPIHQS
jgi:hypothetical protein